MLDPKFVFMAAAIDLAGTSIYALDTLKGKSKPNRVTWILWALIPLITFFAQLSAGVGLPAVYTFILFIGPALIVVASFANRQAYWKLTNFDKACGVSAVLAIVLWVITKDALTAILLSLVADAVAGLPTLIKSYRFPETESANAYLAGIFSSALTLLTIQTWNLANYLFSLYVLIFCIVLYVLIKFPGLRFAKLAK